MKPTKPQTAPDPLDDELDQLFAAEPVAPSSSFTDRVMAEVAEVDAVQEARGVLLPWLAPVVGLAAAVCLGLFIGLPGQETESVVTPLALEEIWLMASTLPTEPLPLGNDLSETLDLVEAASMLQGSEG